MAMEVRVPPAEAPPIEIDLMDLVGYEFSPEEIRRLKTSVKRLNQVSDASVIRQVLFVTVDMGDLPDHLIDRSAQTLYSRIVHLVDGMCITHAALQEHLELVYSSST